jgi:hypothetical protein
MERDSVEWSDGVVTPSAMMGKWVKENGGIAAEVIPYPLGELESAARRQAARSAEEPPADGRKALFAGRLEPRKGVRVLLEGFARAVAQGADLELTIAGEDMPEGSGLHGAKLIAAMPERAKQRVRAIGRVDPERLVELRAAAAVIVVPSPMDNFPNTCMEAMAAGRVVVAARAGGMGEMIRDGVEGVLFEPENAADCARALARVVALSAEARAEMRRRAAQRMLELCGNGVIAARRIGHYERAIAARRRGPPGPGEFIVLGRGRATPGQIARLKRAVACAGVGFAHGWTRDAERRVRVFSTPREETLALGARDIGPVVVERGAARGLKNGMSAWAAAMALCRAGVRGVVAPDVVVGEGEGRVRRLLRALRRG